MVESISADRHRYVMTSLGRRLHAKQYFGHPIDAPSKWYQGNERFSEWPRTEYGSTSYLISATDSCVPVIYSPQPWVRYVVYSAMLS